MQTNRATRLTASTLGVLVGLAGIDHGIFEILQGNLAPDAIMIAAIGPDQRFWVYGEETAVTILPNFLVTGVLAVILGLLVTIWSAFFLQRKHGAIILMALSILLFLFGGGFAPIFMALVASLIATRINRPLIWWRKLFSGSVGSFLAKLWSGMLIAFVVLFVFNVVVAIFGWPLTVWLDADSAFALLNTLANIMLVLMLLSVLTGFAYDVQQLVENETTIDTRST